MASIHHQIFSDSSDKPWILLIHGLFGNLDNLTGLRKLFTNSHQVLAIDLPDHGKSDYTETFSFELYANKIVQLLQQLNINKADILGHSLGGKIAMKIALDHSEIISHLIILDIAPVKYAPRHLDVFKGLNNVHLDTLTSRNEADMQLAIYISEPSTRQFLLKSLYNEAQQWNWRFNLQLLERDYQLLSAAIESDIAFQGAVLFIKGGNSDYLLLEHKQPILKLFPNSQSKLIANTGHWLHAENPNLCHKLISTFIKSV
ncbi:alpha/beta fold hydrolase [Paraglaciecola sp. L3A3]|uniref:alpha/beta fold hydrolase n=1 Tax=Paraglaciecola sp. L3A3 TaxID=2686358 RepID=UPI00131DB18F|nr:alpha/beta fold hydrolase [Paraglaciecola sp. L3A3]